MTLPRLSVFSFCHCQQLKVLCLLSLSVKVRCIVSELQKGGLEATVKDAVVFLLPRLMKVDAAVSPYQKKKKEAPAVNDPSSHRHAVTSTETTSRMRQNRFLSIFFRFGDVVVFVVVVVVAFNTSLPHPAAFALCGFIHASRVKNKKQKTNKKSDKILDQNQLNENM